MPNIKTSTITLLSGALLLIVGFFMWLSYAIDTKIFQLSNDLIGAGVFVVVASILHKVLKD